MQVKIFSSLDPLKGQKSNQQAFEDEINAWLREHPEIEIVRVEQGVTDGALTLPLWMISVWYEER